MSETRPVINLYKYDGLGLILKYPSGVWYSNQVGGYACYHPEEEGVFVPLPIQTGRPEIYALASHFKGSWASLIEEDADEIDRILSRHGLDWLHVDRDHLERSFEAWIHVIIDHAQQYRSSLLFYGFSTTTGVLIWENSD